jgi:parallel beta-helix repeat protein
VGPGTYEEAITLKDGVLVMSTEGAEATTISWPAGSVVTSLVLGDLTLLRGFTVDGGSSASSGLDCSGSYVRIEDCVFTGAGNGASFRLGGAPAVSGCEFRDNQTGGVAVSESSAPVLSGNVFDGNSYGVYTSGDPGPVIGGTLASANDFLSSGFSHVLNFGTAETRAALNYWGDVCVDPAWFYGPVDYVPWTDSEHVGTYTECPDGVSDGEHPEKAFASYNYPNPFNPATAISYQVPAPGGRVRLSIYDLSGRKVRTLVDEHRAAGRHAAVWQGRDDRGRELGSGVYFYRLEIGADVFQRKMVMLK